MYNFWLKIKAFLVTTDFRVTLGLTYLFVLGMFSLFLLYPDVVIYLVFRQIVIRVFG